MPNIVKKIKEIKFSLLSPSEIKAISVAEIIYPEIVDTNGENKILNFDPSSYGSIESGRGFLNFSFILVFTIAFIVMGWNVYDRMNTWLLIRVINVFFILLQQPSWAVFNDV